MQCAVDEGWQVMYVTQIALSVTEVCRKFSTQLLIIIIIIYLLHNVKVVKIKLYIKVGSVILLSV